MNYKIYTAVLLMTLVMFVIAGCDAGSAGADSNRIRFEHLAMNVDNSIEVAEWYRDNLGLKILREGKPPGSKRFLSDPGGNMMFEFYSSKSVV